MGSAAIQAAAAVPPPGWRFAKRLLRNRSIVIGAGLVLFIALLAVSADLIAPYNPLRNNVRARLNAPSAAHWLGTDHFGRDILSRILFGARVSLLIGACTVLLTGLLGVTIGLAAGYFRRLDNPVMRLMDALMAFPAILLAIALAAVLGASVPNVIFALGVATTPHTARVVRAAVLVAREMDYVDAARALGASNLRIILRHILPNVMAPLIVRLTYVFAIAILAEAVLSFIGVGPPPPSPTFGSIIANGRDFIAEAPWVTVFPGIAILMTVLGLNLLGDGLRDVLDPRMRI